ncbi:MAG: HRDC domain-containing protein, partial [Nesterenkonia sp.]
YVGITRARTHLSLSSAAARHAGGRGRRRPSRFLMPLRRTLGLEPEARRIAPGAGRLSPNAASRRRRPVTCAGCGNVLTVGTQIKRRRCQDCPVRYDEQLFEQLRSWRLSYAKELQMKAFMILGDATLELLAEHKPTTDEELLKIPGIGERKLEQHGDRLKAAIWRYVEAE